MTFAQLIFLIYLSKINPNTILELKNLKSHASTPLINYGKNSVRYIAPVLWAKLPEYLGTLASLSSSKGSVRKLHLEDIIRKDCYCSFCK